jgi:hypothetical protein
MRHPFLALSVAVWLVGVVSAQEAAPPIQDAPRGDRSRGWRRDDLAASQKVEKRESIFTIEIKVLEGNGLLHQSWATAKSQSAGIPRAKSRYYLDLPRRMAPPANPPLPNPVAAPENHFRRPDSSLKHDDDLEILPPKTAASATRGTRAVDEKEDLWDDAQMNPSVTVLAAPKLAVVAGRSGVVQIQNVQIFTYLEPLGDAKFQARHTDPAELGMKFVLGVEPVEGDTQAVEVSPLEIQLSVLDGREPVEGLDLDVGKPIIATRSLKTTAKMKLGATRLIPIPSGPKTQAALLLRINRVDTADLQPDPPRSSTIPDPDESSP